MKEHAADAIDLVEVADAIRSGWRRVAGALGLGLIGALVVLFAIRRQFDGAATVLLKSSQPTGGALASDLGLPVDLLPQAFSGNIQSPFETEREILSSRVVAGRVVDSLGLQARVLAPSGIAPNAILVPAVYPGSFKTRRFRFDREGPTGPYRVRGPGTQATAVPGQPLALPVGTITLRGEGLPASFALQILDREDAITRLEKRLKVAKAGGEVARLTYRADDSLTAAAVPNAIVAVYLERRKTIDRGVNQRRLEFVVAFADTVNRRLAEADTRLRRFEEASGVLDPVLIGKMQVERATAVRERI